MKSRFGALGIVKLLAITTVVTYKSCFYGTNCILLNTRLTQTERLVSNVIIRRLRAVLLTGATRASLLLLLSDEYTSPSITRCSSV